MAMNKKEVAATVYFEECLDELSAREFDQVVTHLQNTSDVKFSRYPKPRNVARRLVERTDGAKILTEAIEEVKAANEALDRLEASDALQRLEELEQQAED